MIRRSSISLNLANTGKLDHLRQFVVEYCRVVQNYIDLLWEKEIFYGTFIPKDIQLSVSTWLSYSAQQCSGKQALQIVKSQRRKHPDLRTKPTFEKKTLELDSRFTEIKKSENSFDLWIKFRCMGKNVRMWVPIRKHKHFNQFQDWAQKKSTRLKLCDDGRLFLDIFFEKEAPPVRTGKVIGLDCGFKKLAVTSEGQFLGTQLPAKTNKIARKLQGSKAFQRALTERDVYLNQVAKGVDLTDVGTIVVESLKNVKRNSKGKIQRKVMNKLQRWTYPRFLNRLEQRCEVVGVQWHTVAPAYTSQMCEKCGFIHKENRVGELFKCRSCGYTEDADFNASKNILNRFLLHEPTDRAQERFLA
jgi:IS605 OrfB family transposase